MRNNFKKAVALLLGVIMCAGSLVSLAVPAFAEDATLKRGTFRFAPHTVLGTDLDDYYYYSDNFFAGSALEYNKQLATMSMTLAASSISSQDEGTSYAVKSRNLESLLLDIDFWGFEVNEYYKQEPEEQTMGVGMAYRVIGEGENAYTVLAIVPRSAGYKKEWAGNFTVGKEGLHEGFKTGRDIILEFAKDYVKTYSEGFEGEVKIWTVGYSRGAGVANLLAAALVDNSKEAIGLELKKENIFAYTFGTPSTVQYKDDAEKATFENGYANIWNVWSDYDIVTFAPFKNWNFTYFGKTYNLDVYNAERKAKMLEFLKGTNEEIYNLYTEEGSTADPDNFKAVTFSLVDGSFSYADANPAHGIPTNQKDFLESRVKFLVDNLVPDRATYVDQNYQLALQRITSLYFGLDGDDGSTLLGSMSQNGMMLAGVFYCYFLADCYLTEENVATLAPILSESIATVEGYYKSMVESSPEVAETEWYLAIKEFLESETYTTLKQQLETTVSETLKQYVPAIRQTLAGMAVQMTTEALTNGIEALQLDDTTERDLLIANLTTTDVTEPLTKFIVYLLFGCENGNVFEAFSLSNKHISTAATFVYNAGRYMRVHNNEIILSWLRTDDVHYLEQTHVHDYDLFSNETHHGMKCACGATIHDGEHIYGEWVVTKESTAKEAGARMRTCQACGYVQSEEIPAENIVGKIVVIVVISTAGALAIGGGITAIVIHKKRKKSK